MKANDDIFPTGITIDGDEFEIGSEFCYPGDITGQAGGCIDVVTAHVQSGWINFYLYITFKS